MRCNDCNNAQEQPQLAYYRWKDANIALSGCSKHLREVFAALNSAQHRKHIIDPQADLAFCDVCKGGEGELTTECCNRSMTAEERRRVYEVGDLDFIDGQWRTK